ncbi:hypothetical protein F4604DRAFT_1685567 [Suillus subluteus]|nr:hypothetical protein F4604DRAFT_1685567 [Suillus subluteus]
MGADKHHLRGESHSPTKSHTKSPTKQPSDKTTYRFSEDFNASYNNQGGINPIRLPNGPGKKKLHPNEYLQQWRYRTHDYLDIMLQQEAPPPDRVCCLCGGDGTQECHDCHAQPIFCTKCCWVEHSLRPFHQISQWNGYFFERTTLTKLGVEIHAGHRGKPCPHHDWVWKDTDDEGRYAPGTPGPGEDAPSVEVPPEFPEAYDGDPDVFVEPASGAAAQDFPELFKMGLFLASFTRPKDLHSPLHCWTDFILDNLECGTSAMNYYSKLKCITSSVFPHLVPAISKPNIFTRRAQKTRFGSLTGNVSWWQEPDTKLILPSQRTSAQRSECNNHRAVNQANASRHKLEATGIGGCTCARHGCFVPNSMVDFQKGERQMNMDYAICNALSYNTDGLSRAFTFYDVNCQYYKHLQQRVDESLHLTIPSGMEIVPGIRSLARSWPPRQMLRPGNTKRPNKAVRESTEAFEKLNDAADLEMVQWWEAEENEVQACLMTDPSAMDIYDVQVAQGTWTVHFLEDGLDSDWSSDEYPRIQGGHPPQVLFRPEIAVIPLPSNLGLERWEELGVIGLVRKDITLQRRAGLMTCCMRSEFTWQTRLSCLGPQSGRQSLKPPPPEAWAQVHSMERVINLNWRDLQEMQGPTDQSSGRPTVGKIPGVGKKGPQSHLGCS